MADTHITEVAEYPSLDMIDSEALKSLRENVPFEMFSGGTSIPEPFWYVDPTKEIQEREERERLRAEWKRVAFRRLIAMGVDRERAFYTIGMMDGDGRKKAAEGMRKFLDRRYKKQGHR